MTYIGPHTEGDIVKGNPKTLHGVNGSLRVETTFLNFTAEYLVVCFRDGTYAILPPMFESIDYGSLLVGHSKRGFGVQLKIEDGDESELNKLLSMQLKKNDNNTFWEESVSLDIIKNSRLGVYLSNSDGLVILFSYIDKLPLHPFCRQHVHNKYLNTLDDFNPKHDIGITIRLICNSGITSTHYVVLNNRILVVNPKKSNTLQDGVYIGGLSTLYSDNSNNIRRDEYYSYEEINSEGFPLPIFPRLSQAREYISQTKNIDQRIEHEKFLTEIKLEKERIEASHTLKKAELVQQRLELEERERKSQLEMQNMKAQAEQELLRLKEESAIKSGENKQNTEMIKLIGAGIGLTILVAKILL